MQNCTRSKIAGAIAGMVLGDALGVPGELWPREKVRERFGWIDVLKITSLHATSRRLTTRMILLKPLLS